MQAFPRVLMLLTVLGPKVLWWMEAFKDLQNWRMDEKVVMLPEIKPFIRRAA